MDDAVCRAVDPETFFDPTPPSRLSAREACSTCPAVADCLTSSLMVRETDGIWAGFSAYQRRQIRNILTSDGSAITVERVRSWLIDPKAPTTVPDEPDRRPYRRRQEPDT